MKDCNGQVSTDLKFRSHSTMAVAVIPVPVFGEGEEMVERGKEKGGGWT